MTMLIAAAAKALDEMTARLRAKLDGKNGSRDQAVLDLLREVFTETAAIRFEGNGYSDEWKQEAARRGLPNLPDTPSALAALADPKRTEFLVEMGIFSERELGSRLNVSIERYIKTVTLEAETLVEILNTQVLPAGEKQLQQSAEAAKVIEAAAGKNLPLAKRLGCLGAVVGEVAASVDKLQSLLGRVDQMHDEDGGSPRARGRGAARDGRRRARRPTSSSNWSTMRCGRCRSTGKCCS
jgi:glutamine synthetase